MDTTYGPTATSLNGLSQVIREYSLFHDRGIAPET